MPRTYDWKRSRHRLTNPNYATRRPGITHPKKSTRPCQRKGLWSCGLPVKKNAPTAKKAGKWFQGHDESECHHKKKDEAEAALQAIKERRERTGKGRHATQSEKRAFAAGAIINKGPAAAQAAAGGDQYPKSLPASSPHAIAYSAAAVLDQRHVRHPCALRMGSTWETGGGNSSLHRRRLPTPMLPCALRCLRLTLKATFQANSDRQIV